MTLPFFSACQTLVNSAGGEQIDADENAASVADHCLQASVDNAKLFDQALVLSTCTNCTNFVVDTISRETLAAEVNKDTTSSSIFLKFVCSRMHTSFLAVRDCLLTSKFSSRPIVSSGWDWVEANLCGRKEDQKRWGFFRLK